MIERPPGAVFGVPPGADFVRTLFENIHDHMQDRPPEDIVKMHVLLPNRRMQRRLKSLFEYSGSSLLPRIGLVTDISHLLPDRGVKANLAGLGRLLSLKQVVARLVALDPRLTSADVIDLTLSLTKLLDEMQGEGVPFSRLEGLELEDHSGHWAQSLSFLKAITDYVDALDATARDPQAIHREMVIQLCHAWSSNPPNHPVIVAGSTGSRSTTRLLMGAVSKLPKGALLLPGFDFDLPDAVWDSLLEDPIAEDHPQFRFAKLLAELGLGHESVQRLGTAPDEARNRLVSLAMRPAPVTDQWLTDGPRLGSLPKITSGLAFMEARDSKTEAAAIALAIRGEIEEEKSVALIAPDATLARRVAGELIRWNVVPDDSGGVPLALTPAGRFLRQTALVSNGASDLVACISLLKHPMTQHGAARGVHMRFTQEFELFARGKGAATVDHKLLSAFKAKLPEAAEWCAWLEHSLEPLDWMQSTSVKEVLNTHKAVTERFAGPSGLLQLADGDAGRKITELQDDFERHAEDDVPLTPQEYLQLLELSLAADSARVQVGVHPDVMIWGTLEARAQGADVVILGGLNEGVWPEQPPADPWLNRAMRREVGLLLPDRQIGLAAHDFQQAIGAQKVVLSRSRRSDGSETVPSRWLSRLTNLLNGLTGTDGNRALEEMIARGQVYLDQAAALDRPQTTVDAAHRPAPAPPVHTRPKDFAVTDIQKLIRDPYAIYARQILRLKPLNPIVPEMDTRRKGTVFHSVLEKFYDPKVAFDDENDTYDRLRAIADDVLQDAVPDDATRVAWWAQLHRNQNWMYEREVARRTDGFPMKTEVAGRFDIPGTGFSLRGTADRIDQLNTGRLVIYDYKTGTPPSKKNITFYDRQLILEAIMAEQGAFRELTPTQVDHAVHIGVGRTPVEQKTELNDANATALNLKQLVLLLEAFLEPTKGYVSRRAMESVRYDGDYDHLARFGEWDDAAASVTEQVGI